MKDFLRTSDLTTDDLRRLLDRASDLKRDPDRGRAVLRGQTVVLYFEKPSTRTRLSFETAVVRLGGHPIFASASDLHVARGESLEDTARAGSRYSRAWVLRMFRHADIETFARAATVPVINALSNEEHPCQSLADLLTIRERFGGLDGVVAAWVGPVDNVAASFLDGAALGGMQVRIAAPPGFGGRPPLGAGVTVVDRPDDAVRGADVVATSCWACLGDDPREAEARSRTFAPFRVDTKLMSLAKSGAVFLHAMPAHRDEEVTAEVLDGPRSLVLEQTENRLHTTVALLEMLLRAELTGRAKGR